MVGRLGERLPIKPLKSGPMDVAGGDPKLGASVFAEDYSGASLIECSDRSKRKH